MIFGVGELTELCFSFGLKRGWGNFPTARILLAIRREAVERDDGSGDPRIEAAALFYEAARDERRLGDAKDDLPILLARYHMDNHGLTLTGGNIDALLDLRDDIASGDVAWEHVKEWFGQQLSRVG